MHFWEIIKLQFEKEHHTLLCILIYFTIIIIIHELSWKNAWLPPISFFLDFNDTCQDLQLYISCIIINQGKNTFELVGSFLKCRLMRFIYTPKLLYTFISSIESFHKNTLIEQINLLLTEWLHSSVGRALHWHRRGHGFKSHWTRLGFSFVYKKGKELYLSV